MKAPCISWSMALSRKGPGIWRRRSFAPSDAVDPETLGAPRGGGPIARHLAMGEREEYGGASGTADAAPLGMTPSGGQVIANRFRLVRELGRGGMGSVWLADHLTLEVRCAVKLIVGEGVFNPEYVRRLHEEARTMAQVQSPHVVRVLDHDVRGDVPYIAMELLEGEDLRARLMREGVLEPLATYKIISQIALGLAKAHAAGVVHRDLKPENVFLAEDDDKVIVKVLDFGIANLAASRVALAGGSAEALVGTLEYMSPEHARGMGAIDHRADVWALGVIAFECVTGRLPFAAATISELFARITAETLPVPSDFVRDLPAGVDGWWVRAMSRNIDMRFQSARELACALGTAMGIGELGHPTSPRPTGPTSPEGLLPGLPDPSSPRRSRRLGYPVSVAGMMAALVLPLAADGQVAPPGVTVSAARHAVEATGEAPPATLARMEVEAMPSPAPSDTAPSAASRPTRPPGQPAPTYPSPRVGRSHVRTSSMKDPDAVLGFE